MPDGDMTPDRHGYSTPRPDPTLLTTEQLMREIANLRGETMLHIQAATAQLEGEIKLTAERFSAMRGALDERHASQNFAITAAAEAAQHAAASVEKLFDSKLNSARELLDERYENQRQAVFAAFDAAEKSVAQQMQAADRAVEKANMASERRFESVNEFRAQQGDLVRTFVPRQEIDTMINGLEKQVNDLKSVVEKGLTGVDVRREQSGEQREDSRSNIALWIAMASVAVTLVLTVVTALHVAR